MMNDDSSEGDGEDASDDARRGAGAGARVGSVRARTTDARGGRRAVDEDRGRGAKSQPAIGDDERNGGAEGRGENDASDARTSRGCGV